MHIHPKRMMSSWQRVVTLLAGLLTLLVLLAPAAPAQDAAPDPEPDAPQAELPDTVFSAPVVVDGETLFIVRGFSALPADERADMIVRRIVGLAEASTTQVPVFEVKENEFGLAIRGNGRLLTVTTRADAEFEQTDLDILAQLHLEAIQAAVENYRAGRSDEARVESALVAIAWTLGFALLTLLFVRKRQRIVDAVERLVIKRLNLVEAATNAIVRGKAVGRLIGFLVNAGLWIIFFVGFYYYLSFVLLSFTETRPIAQILLTYVTQPLFDILMGFVSYMPNFITLVIIAVVTSYLIKGSRLFMDNVEAGTFEWKNFEPHWIAPTFNIARVVIIAIAVVFAYPYIPGSDSRAFQGLTILAGIMVSLGSNTVVSNMMAGLFVIYRRSTNIGDRIKVGELIGDVVEIKLMETLIKSIKNEMISIPNAQLLNSEVINYSRKIDGRGLLVHTTVGIGYEEAPEKIEAMLIEAARRTGGLKKSPDPFVLWTALADYAINYQINAFTTRGSSLPKILSDLHRNIVAVFNENGVQIMTPSYIADPEQPKIATEVWDGKLANTASE